MKNISILAFAFGLIFSTTALSQNIENVKKETIVKKVTVKDTVVQTVIEKDVNEEVSVTKVEGTDKTNQTSEEQIVKDVKTKSLDVTKEGVNLDNQKNLEKVKEEETKRIDGQQRGVPIQTKKDSTSVELQKVKVKKEGGK